MCHNYIHVTKCEHLTPLNIRRKHIQESLIFKKLLQPPYRSLRSKLLFIDSAKTYVVSTQKNRLRETVLLRTKNTRLTGVYT